MPQLLGYLDSQTPLTSDFIICGGQMHVIEKVFGVAPDGGNGFLELAFLAVPLVIILLACTMLSARRTNTALRDRT